MLSTKLSSLSERLAAHSATGQPVGPAMTGVLADVLADLADRARAIEGEPIPPLRRGGAVTVVHGGRAA